jgi:catechol 2,3-dioxygenase-like lactoylglutathione lyase family enzyme
MNAPTPTAKLPGPIRQIGFVVTDADKALESWVALGVGPWYLVRGQHQRALYRGAPCDVTLTIAFANSGDMQVEVIQQENDTPIIYTEFLATKGDGFNQFAYWADDFDATVKSVQDAGWPVVWSGGESDGVRYVYAEPPGGPAAIIEIMELNEATTGLGEFVRAAADGWDGSDPIRSLLGD